MVVTPSLLITQLTTWGKLRNLIILLASCSRRLLYYIIKRIFSIETSSSSVWISNPKAPGLSLPLVPKSKPKLIRHLMAFIIIKRWIMYLNLRPPGHNHCLGDEEQSWIKYLEIKRFMPQWRILVSLDLPISGTPRNHSTLSQEIRNFTD